MRRLIQFVRNLANRAETMQVGVGAWCALFVSIVLVRDLVEGFSGNLPLVHPVDFFLHYPLAFINPLLVLAMLLAIGSGERVERVTRIMLVAWLLVLIPPVVDMVLGVFGAAPERPHIGFTPIFRGEYLDRFIHFLDPTRQFQGTTAGIRVECFVEVVLAAAYVLMKRGPGGWLRAVGTVIAVYSVSLIFFSWPFHLYNLTTPAEFASMEGMRGFMVEQGLVARTPMDRFSYGSGAMHGLLLAVVTVSWFWIHAGGRALRVFREFGRHAALGGSLVVAGLALGLGRFVSASGTAFEPTVLDMVFACAAVIAGAAVGFLVGLLGSPDPEMTPEERRGAVVAAVAVAVVNSQMVSYAVFTTTMVAMAISVLRTIRPFAVDRIAGAGALLRGLQAQVYVLIGFSVIARGEVLQALPAKFVGAALVTAALGGVALQRGPVGRFVSEAGGTWGAFFGTGGGRRMLDILRIGAPFPLALAYPSTAVTGAALAASLAQVPSAFTAWGRSRLGVPALVVFAVYVLSSLGDDPRVVGDEKVDPPSIRAEFALGYGLLWSDHVELARAQFDRVIEQAPRRLRTYREAAGLHQQLGDEAQSVAVARTAVQRAPGDPEAWSFLGTTLTRQGDYDAALEAYGRSLSLDGKNVETLRAMGVVAGLGGREVAMRSAMERGLVLAPGDPFFVDGLLSVRLSIVNGASPDSVDVYRHRAESDPRDVDARLQAAMALAARDDVVAAMALLESAESSVDPLAAVVKARLLVSLDRADDALEVLDGAIVSGAEIVPLREMRAAVHRVAGRPAFAIADLQFILDHKPGDIDRRLALASAYFEAGQPVDAIAVLEGLELGWWSRTREEALGIALRRYIQERAAARDKIAVELLAGAAVESTRPRVLVVLARELANARIPHLADAVFQRAEMVAPGDFWPSQQRGLLLHAFGQHEAAAASLRRAVELGANEVRVFDALAKAYDGMGRPDLAAAVRRQAASEAPEAGVITQ